VQTCDLYLLGLTKRLIRQLNTTGDANVQSLRIANCCRLSIRLRSANVIAFFRNPGIRACVRTERSPVAFSDVDLCRSLSHPFATQIWRNLTVRYDQTRKPMSSPNRGICRVCFSGCSYYKNRPLDSLNDGPEVNHTLVNLLKYSFVWVMFSFIGFSGHQV
jgi:hypothetical protein